jgi:hypothetical protein
MMTASERKAAAIARMLVKALRALELFMDDPEMVLEDARMYARREPKGVQEAVQAIAAYYLED